MDSNTEQQVNEDKAKLIMDGLKEREQMYYKLAVQAKIDGEIRMCNEYYARKDALLDAIKIVQKVLNG